MKQILIALTVSAITALPVMASDIAKEPAHVESVEHYQGEKIETSDQAFEILNDKTSEIGKILEKEGELEFLEMENIHEISYSLEAAIDKIREENAAETPKIDSLDEAIQAIHYASENQEEEKTRKWFVKLKPAVDELKSTQEAHVAPKKQEFYQVVIKNNRFTPEEIIVPAGEKIKLIVDNQDPTPEEFESHDMNREKIILGNSKVTIFIGPLKPGKHHFFGEFNMATANGYIIAK